MDAHRRTRRDFIARAGGDRFLILQSSVTRPSQIARLANRLHDEIKQPIVFGDKTLHVNASFGMAPILIELAVVMLAYRVVPHHTVKWRHAIAGSLLVRSTMNGDTGGPCR